MRTGFPVLGSLILGALLPASVFGQASGDVSDSGVFSLEEVIVTATRRAESLQDIAISISSFSGEFIKDTGITQLKDIENYTPSLRINSGTATNETSIRIRGIGSVGSNTGIDPSVGMFVDGVYQGRSGMSISDLIDIERIEVLRGPQGTLYGKNTAAGAISIITARPHNQFGGRAELVYNSDKQAELRGTVNVPFGDSGHAMTLTGFGIRGDHLYENTNTQQYAQPTSTDEGINNANRWGGKARFLFDGGGAGEFLLSMDYTKEDTDCCALGVIEYDGLSNLAAPNTNTPNRTMQLWLASLGKTYDYSAFEDDPNGPGSPPKPDPFGDDRWFNTPLKNEVDFGGVALQWDYDLPGDILLTWINAWRQYNSSNTLDGDFTAYDAVSGSTDVEFNQYSSELRFTSPGGETLDWIGGLYAYHSDMDSVGTFRQSAALTDKIPGLGPLFPDGTLNTDTNDYKTTSYAAFGQMIWNVTDKFSATLGLRYTYEKKERTGSQISDPTFFIDIPPIVGRDIYYDNSRSDSDLSPMINLRYFIQPEIMIYGSISRGFKSGGFDQRRQTSGETGEFDEEIATNYEAGWKGTFFDNQFRLNGTFYFINYDDFQSQTFDGNSLKVTNAGSLQSYGTELEAMWVANEHLILGTAIGYNKAEYKEFENGQCTVEQQFNFYYIEQDNNSGVPGTSLPCTQDLAGEPLDNAPEWTASSYLQYQHNLGSSLQGIARLEHNYIDSFFLDQDLDPVLEQDAINLINLRLTLSDIDKDWEVVLWGTNLLDEGSYSFAIDIPVLGGYAGVVAPQRTYGLTLRYNFGE